MNISEAIAILLMGLFLYSAFAKMLDFVNFSTELSKSPFLQGYTGMLAYVIPLSEVVIAVLLLVPHTRLLALYIYLYMMASFTFYIYLMMTKAYHLPCACMGIFGTVLSWEQHLMANTVITLLVFVGIILHIPNKKYMHSPHPTVPPEE